MFDWKHVVQMGGISPQAYVTLIPKIDQTEGKNTFKQVQIWSLWTSPFFHLSRAISVASTTKNSRQQQQQRQQAFFGSETIPNVSIGISFVFASDIKKTHFAVFVVESTHQVVLVSTIFFWVHASMIETIGAITGWKAHSKWCFKEG